MLTYSELIKNRRSIREFLDKKVSTETIKEILQDACLAPSSHNKQPWEFIVITDRQLIKRLSDESRKNLLNEIENNQASSNKEFKSWLSDDNANVFYNAPCLIFIVGKNDYNHFKDDCSLAAAYLMFAATARGLGSCWIGLGAHINSQELKKEINLPTNYEIVAPIVIGYPTNIPPETPRKALEILCWK